MLRIRLARMGKKRQPYYRVVVADVEAKRDGRIVERIGHYTPLTDPSTYEIDEGRALYWLSVGAQPSDAVRHLLEKQGTYDRLARVRAGESIESLAAEFQGSAATATTQKREAKVAEVEATVDDEAVAEDVVAEAEAVAVETVDEAAVEEE